MLFTHAGWNFRVERIGYVPLLAFIAARAEGLPAVDVALIAGGVFKRVVGGMMVWEIAEAVYNEAKSFGWLDTDYNRLAAAALADTLPRSREGMAAYYDAVERRDGPAARAQKHRAAVNAYVDRAVLAAEQAAREIDLRRDMNATIDARVYAAFG